MCSLLHFSWSPSLYYGDDERIACLSNLNEGGLSTWSLLKATIPVRLGGIGLREASLHAPAIFVASVSACSTLILSLSGLEVPSSYLDSPIWPLPLTGISSPLLITLTFLSLRRPNHIWLINLSSKVCCPCLRMIGPVLSSSWQASLMLGTGWVLFCPLHSVSIC